MENKELEQKIREEFEIGFNEDLLLKEPDETYKDSEMQFGFEMYESGRMASIKEIEKHYNRELNIIKDCREFCSTLGEKSLEDFKDDEDYVQNRYYDLSNKLQEKEQEIKRLKKELNDWSKYED